MLIWIVLGFLALLLLAAVAGKPPAARRKARRAAPPHEAVTGDEDALDLLARDAPAALARYGTPEVAQMLEEQGRGEELRGLGYRE
jgi:hypothetical protein